MYVYRSRSSYPFALLSFSLPLSLSLSRLLRLRAFIRELPCAGYKRFRNISPATALLTLQAGKLSPGVRPPPRAFLLPRAFFLRSPFSSPPVLFQPSSTIVDGARTHARVDEHAGPSYDVRLNSNGPAPQRAGIFLSSPGKGLRRA